ncbi:MAG: SRPBCC family protein [Actinomycetota bacterium]
MDLKMLKPSTFASVTTDAPLERVWQVAANPLLLPRFSPELQAIRLLGGDHVQLGSQFEGDQLRGERTWTTTSTVTKFEEGRVFEWTVGDLEAPVSRWSFLLDAHPGGCTLTQKVVLLGGPSPLTTFIQENPPEAEDVIRERLDLLRERMAATIHGLLQLA